MRAKIHQLGALAALSVAAAVFFAVLLPDGAKQVAVLVPVIFFVAWVYGLHVGPGEPYQLEPLMVWFAALTIYALLLGHAQSPFDLPGAAAIATAAFAATGAFAVERYPVLPAPSSRESAAARARSGLRIGLFVAAAFSLIATLIIGAAGLVGVVGGVDDAGFATFRQWLLVVAGYFGAGVTVGPFVRLTGHVGRWPIGAMLLGIPGAALVYGIVGWTANMAGALREPQTTPEVLATALGIGVAAGPGVGLIVRSWNLVGGR